MKRNSLLLFALIIVGSVSGQTFTEILGRPTNNSITASILFDTQVEMYLEYGVATGNYTLTTAVVQSQVNLPIVTKISGLQPETRYYYRTRYRKPATTIFLAGAEHSFITQRKKGSLFVFSIEADPHPYDPKGYHPLWDICLQNQLNDKADFMLDLGDTFGDDHQPTTITSTQVKQLMLNNREHFGLVCHSMPFFFCQGNHEGESGYYLLQSPPNNLATYETLWRKTFYPNPEPDGFYSGNSEVEAYGMDKPQNYYAWEWGDALFVVVDSYRYYTVSAKPRNWEWTIGKTQYDWLKQTLETSKAKYKFVFTHHILGESRGGINVAKTFEWGGLDNGMDKFAANRPGWAMPIHKLLVNTNVTAFFQGHDHVYAREELDNVVYQTVPMPSDSSYALGYIANGGAFSGTVLKGAGHVRVSVCPDSVKVDFVSAVLPKHETPTNKNANILYSYSIKPKTISAINNLSLETKKDICNIYPIPAKELVHLRFQQSIEPSSQLTITSVDGQILRTQTLPAMQEGEELSLPTMNSRGQMLLPGLYFVSLQTGNRMLMCKPIIVTK